MLRFFVIMLIMINIKIPNTVAKSSAFFKLLIGLFVFSSLLLAVTIFLRTISQQSTQEQVINTITTAVQTEVNPSEFPKQVIKYTKITDKGLELYRDEQTKDIVLWFYQYITGSESVTNAILEYADKNDIPLSLAFSLSYVESRYKARAVNRNRNSTTDRGLFQLNSKSFPKLSEKEFFDPQMNAKYGLSHLRFCLDTAGNEVAALAMYNAGTTKVSQGATPKVTLDYISQIMSYREGLEQLFAQEVVAKYPLQQEAIRLASMQ